MFIFVQPSRMHSMVPSLRLYVWLRLYVRFRDSIIKWGHFVRSRREKNEGCRKRTCIAFMKVFDDEQ
jgi:hypothetical protein